MISKDDNEDDSASYLNKVLMSELESKWKEIEDKKKMKKEKKTNQRYKTTNTNDILIIDSESLHKLIHPIDSSFDDFAAKMLAQLESMKP